MNASTTRRSCLLGAAFVAGTIALTGCSAGMQEHDSSASAGGEAPYNDADVVFAQGMIPHHE